MSKLFNWTGITKPAFLTIRRFCSGDGSKPSIRSFKQDASRRMIDIQWSDGKCGRFPYVWLRDMSPDPSTYTFSAAMTARNLTMREFDVEVQPKSVKMLSDSSGLVLEWPDGIKSTYSCEWLRLRNQFDQQMRDHRKSIYLDETHKWNAQKIEPCLGRFQYDKFMNDDRVLHDFLTCVCRDGIALLSGCTQDAVAQIGKRIGFIHRTHFGTIFELQTKSDASNMAYASSNELPFHTDFPSLSDPPQLQMLHMLQRANQGGHNLFVDGFYIAEQMRTHHQKEFEVLSRVNIEYIEQGYDSHPMENDELETFHYDMAAKHRVICTDSNGHVKKIQFGNAMRSWLYDCHVDEIQSVYRAMKLFTELCYRPENILELQLQNGDTVLWANTRLLHTRTAFTASAERPRTLKGCYFSWDIVKSRVRQLRDKLAHPLNQPCV